MEAENCDFLKRRDDERIFFLSFSVENSGASNKGESFANISEGQKVVPDVEWYVNNRQ